MKVCSECKQEKPEDRFYKRTYKSGNVGLQHTCKDCSSTVRKRHFKPHSKIKYQLGLTWEQVAEFTAPGACENCGSTKKLCIDHCHETKKPRGLLCHKCNTALGLLDDDRNRIVGLSRYLEQREQRE